MDEMSITLSTLPKTWLFDLDGTIAKHNGYLIDGFDTALSNTINFIKSLPETDKIIILTSRSSQFSEKTELFLAKYDIRFDYIIYDLPLGERILVNDKKQSGLKTAFSINLDRDIGFNRVVNVDQSL